MFFHQFHQRIIIDLITGHCCAGNYIIEIKNTSDAVDGISEEVSALDDHKTVIESGITSLTEFAEQNADSAKVTTENMEEFQQIVDQCNQATERIVTVSDELVGYLGKVNANVKDKIGGRN